jgi:uncharacterized OsmC-like protein
MKISSTIKNSYGKHDITVSTENSEKKIDIAGKAEGYGSSINGGELLFLSLATCFCNDLYREAKRREMTIVSVEVSCDGEFGREGEPASNIVYQVQVTAPSHTPEEIKALIEHVDRIAEVHNTLRKGIEVTLRK